MAIIDYLLEFTAGEGQKITAAAASDYRIDFGQKAPTTGLDTHPMTAVFTIKAAVTGKLQIKLQDCDTETGSYTDCAASLELNAPAAGTVITIPVPYHHKRYMQAYFGGPTAGGPTAGTIHGCITTGMQDNVPPEVAPSVASQF